MHIKGWFRGKKHEVQRWERHTLRYKHISKAVLKLSGAYFWTETLFSLKNVANLCKTFSQWTVPPRCVRPSRSAWGPAPIPPHPQREAEGKLSPQILTLSATNELPGPPASVSKEKRKPQTISLCHMTVIYGPQGRHRVYLKVVGH